MDTVAIDRLDARYRLPASAVSQKERLDRILSAAAGDILEAALERAGVPVHEEICIRSVQSLARLRLSAPDSTLAAAWSLSLAEAIRRSVGRPGADVVHYGSRHHALLDLVAGVASGDLRRAWAWRQIGLWTAGDAVEPEAAAEEAMRALAAQPQAGMAALAAAARMGALPLLLARTRPAAWQSLARAGLAAVGASAELCADGGPAEPSALDAAPRFTAGRVTDAAARIRRRSAVASAAVAIPPARLDAGRARALAVMAILEVEPASLRQGGSFAAALAVEVESRLLEGSSFAVPPPRDPRRLDAAVRHDDGRAAGGYSRSDGALAGSSSAVERADRPSRVGGDHLRAREALRPDGATASGMPSPVPPEADACLPEVRRRGTTGTGGLLFLLHIVSALELPDEIAAGTELGERPLRWVLHRLALALAAVAPDDAAALTFAGLAPDAEPPSREEKEASEVELAAVDVLRARVVAALRQLLARPEDPEALLLGLVCRRRAEIVADPGWVEIRLSLDEASTEIRRAGLDLDPGWLPWLGVVMRFTYA
jgi:hypothetical protein